MTALAATAVAAPQVIGGGKYHAAAFQIKIPLLQRQRLRRRRRRRLGSITSGALHRQSNPILVDSHRRRCLKSAIRQVLGKPVSAMFAQFRRCPRNGKRYDTASLATAPQGVGRRCSWPPRATCASPETGLSSCSQSRGGRLRVWREAPRLFIPASDRVSIALGHAGVHGKAAS